MLKKTLLIGLSAILAQGAFAEVLSPAEALQRAKTQNGARKLVSSTVAPKLAYTAKSQNGKSAVYVFNQGDNSLILSASSLTLPVLGYTDGGNFDPANIPPQLQVWLNEYAAQVEYAEENNIQPTAQNVTVSYPSDWTYIAPLVQTTWDQGRPYSNELKNYAYATGCVATAMAQIMKYHEFPAKGHGSITYTDAYGSTYSMDFGEEPFDWANMLNSYAGNYTDAQAKAVAYLMKACGYSTKMNYSSSSGTQAENAGIALTTYFDYDSSLEALQRYSYTASEWATILYNQLKNKMPVLYSGSSLGNMAHAFVADGYDGQGYFHINWGWSGQCNGFYSLDAMIPTVQGTGGSNYGGYNYSQGMIVNIKPAESSAPFNPEAQFTLLGNVSGENTGSVLTLTMTEANPGNLCNNSLVAINDPTLGIMIENVNGGSASYEEMASIQFWTNSQAQPNIYDWRNYNLAAFGPGSFLDAKFRIRARLDSNLPDGKYKVTLVWKDNEGDRQWHNFEIANGCHDYIYVTKADNTYTIENLPMERFTVTSAEILTPLYMRNPCEIQFTVTNPYDNELSQSIVPVLLYGEDKVLSFEGDSQVVTVGPKETKTVTAVYTFNTVSGGTSPTTSTPREYTLGAYDYSLLLQRYYQTGYFAESYYGDLGTVTMKRPGTNATIRARSIAITNAAEQGMVDEIGFMYGINNFNNIKVAVTIEGQNGFVSSPLSAVVTLYDRNSGTNVQTVYEQNFDNLIYVEAGSTSTETINLNFKEFDPANIYNLSIYYVQQNVRQSLGSIRFGASSGVSEVLGTEGLTLNYEGGVLETTSGNGIATLTVYDLSGSIVANLHGNGKDRLSFSTLNLGKGVYLVKATDNAGSSKTLKFAK